jgi:hypothetical protein
MGLKSRRPLSDCSAIGVLAEAQRPVWVLYTGHRALLTDSVVVVRLHRLGLSNGHTYLGIGGMERPARTASTTARASAARYSSP